jgi:protein gp37
MNKTKIEWCDYTWNPVKGLCPVGCEYCYTHKIYKRFKWNPKIRFDEKELKALSQLKRRLIEFQKNKFKSST